MVGLAGLEPTTFRPPDGRATRLRHSPTMPPFYLIHDRGQVPIRDAAGECRRASGGPDHPRQHRFEPRYEGMRGVQPVRGGGRLAQRACERSCLYLRNGRFLPDARRDGGLWGCISLQRVTGCRGRGCFVGRWCGGAGVICFDGSGRAVDVRQRRNLRDVLNALVGNHLLHAPDGHALIVQQCSDAG